MNCVIYYSNTGHSKRIAEYFAEQTDYPLFDLTSLKQYNYDTAILVFPVHCQSIPKAVKSIIPKLNALSLVTIATYGKMSYGNALYEFQKLYKHDIVAAAYIPTKHSYLSDDEEFTDFNALSPIFEKLNDQTPISIPKAFKNPFSSVFPSLRSRIGIKIYKDDNCDDCGVCNSVCDRNAIVNGKISQKCIRCLKCVTQCPKRSLHFSKRLPMRVYLRKTKVNKLVIYV